MKRAPVLAVLSSAALGAALLPGGAASGGEEPPVVVEVLVPDHAAPTESAPVRCGPGRWSSLDGWVVGAGGGRILTPAVEGNRVFVGSGYDIHCYAAMGGRRGWSKKVDDSQPSAPAVRDGHVYFNTQSCTLYDFEAATGRLAWSAWVAGSVNTTPAVLDGRVFVSGPAEGGGKLEAYDAGTGRLLFRRPLPRDVISSPVAADGRVYYALTDGTLAAADLDGEPLWQSAAKAISAPWPHGERLFVASAGDDGEPALLDLDAATGTPSGREVATPPDVRRGMFVGGIGDRPGAGGGAGPGRAGPDPAPKAGPQDGLRDRPNGPGKGGKKPPPPVVDPSSPPAPAASGGPGFGSFGYEGPRPTVVGGVVALPGKASILLRDIAGGGERRVAVEDGTVGSPAVAGGLLLQATGGGRLLAVDPATGGIRFEIHLRTPRGPLPLCSSPSVARGRVYLGTADGRLVAVDLPEPAMDGWPMWGGDASRAR